MHSTNSQAMSRRNRIIFSCDRCRARKIKCNREDPCASCAKLKQECVYTVSKERENQITIRKSDKETANQILSIKKKIALLEGKLESPHADAINFNKSFDTGQPLLIKNKIFPFLLLMKRDPGLLLVWEYGMRIQLLNKAYFDKSQLLAYLSDEKKKTLSEKAKLICGPSYVPSREEGYSLSQLKAAVGMNPLFNFSGNFSDPIASFYRLIPPAWVNQKLLDVFFQEVYPLVPIIDEMDFRKSIDKLLGPIVDGQYINSVPNVSSGDDFPLLALFLLIIRITYLHSPSSSEFSVSYDVYRAADVIMKEFNVNKRPSLGALQGEFMLRFYVIATPELHAQISTVRQNFGSLIQSAYSLSLHRDPTYLGDTDPRLIHLKRKIWHILVRFDIMESVLFQTMQSTNPQFYDTKLPNVEDIDNASEIEKKVVEVFYRCDDLFYLLRQLCQIHASVNQDTPVSTVIDLLQQIEVQLHNYPISLHVLGFADTINYFIVYSTKIFMAYTYYCIYLFKENSLKDEYLIKAMNILFVQLAGTSTYSPLLVRFHGFYLHTILLIVSCLRMRVGCIIYENRKANIAQPPDLESCGTYLKIISYSFVKELGTYATSYNCSWQLRRVFMNLFKILERASDIFISSDPDVIKKAAATIPVTEINQILKRYIEMKGLKHSNFFQPTENEVIDEMQIENFWNALETIDTEESEYSSWIDQVNNDKLNFELDFDVWKFA